MGTDCGDGEMDITARVRANLIGNFLQKDISPDFKRESSLVCTQSSSGGFLELFGTLNHVIKSHSLIKTQPLFLLYYAVLNNPWVNPVSMVQCIVLYLYTSETVLYSFKAHNPTLNTTLLSHPAIKVFIKPH